MRLNPRTRRLLPWCAGILLLAILLWRVSVGDTLHEIQSARLELLLPLLATACVAWFLIDAAAFAFLFSRFNTPLSFREARELRGLTYLLTPIHWNLGRAAIVARLHRSHGIGLIEATSSLALYQTIDAIALSALSWIGLSRLPVSATTQTLQIFVAIFCIALTVYFLLLHIPARRIRFLNKIRAAGFHHAHRQARGLDVLAILGFRVAYCAVFVAVYYWGAAAFGLQLPLALVVASVPIIQGVGALPISPAGLGTQQAAMLYFFSAHGDAATIIAFGLSFPVLCIVLRSLIGWSYLHRLTRIRTGRIALASSQTR